MRLTSAWTVISPQKSSTYASSAPDMTIFGRNLVTSIVSPSGSRSDTSSRDVSETTRYGAISAKVIHSSVSSPSRFCRGSGASKIQQRLGGIRYPATAFILGGKLRCTCYCSLRRSVWGHIT
ncbi:hypothetical protein I7I48_06962 [Histoplasma ohiense]|nr:hypothetical protein I7I48_06962 [Histoplasma ohiense (nom. inval.)]